MDDGIEFLMRTAAQSVLHEAEAGRRVDPRRLAWAYETLDGLSLDGAEAAAHEAVQKARTQEAA